MGSSGGGRQIRKIYNDVCENVTMKHIILNANRNKYDAEEMA